MRAYMHLHVHVSCICCQIGDPPEFNLTYAFGDDIIAVGGSANVTLTVTTQPNSLHSPMNMEIIMPFENNAPILRICKAEIIRAGANLPCFDLGERNADIYYTNKCVHVISTRYTIYST